MKNKITTILIVVLSATAGVFGSYLVFKGGDVGDLASVTATKGSEIVKTRTEGSVKKVTKISIVENNGKKSVQIVEAEQIRPGMIMPNALAEDEIDEENLTEAQKSVLKELQDALDDNNLRRVRKALSKFLAKAEAGGLGGNVPVCMRMRAVEALAWFGKDAAVDLIDFVADANEDVSNDAFSAFEQALSDCEMGDRARSDLLVSTMKALTDAEQVDSLLNQLNDMRNSVKAEAALEILQTGSDAAKAKLAEQMETYFDEDVKDAAALEKWKAMNPDDPGDEEMYGGSK